MAGKGQTYANDLLKLIFQGIGIANIADNASSGPLANLYMSLHTAEPGPAGDQTTSECAYGSYARQPLARSSGGFTISGYTVSPAANTVFPTASSGSEVASHYAIGTDASGAGKILYSGPLIPPINIFTGIPPTVKSVSTIKEF